MLWLILGLAGAIVGWKIRGGVEKKSSESPYRSGPEKDIKLD